MTTELETILSEIEARAERATGGKWKAQLNHKPFKVVWIDKREAYSTLELKPEDADFIAASRTDVPALCAALREALTALRDSAEWFNNGDAANQSADAIARIAAHFAK